MGLYPVAVCYNARQDNRIQYNTTQYNTITHITQNNIQHSRRNSIRKITENLEHTLYTIQTQERVECEVDGSSRDTYSAAEA